MTVQDLFRLSRKELESRLDELQSSGEVTEDLVDVLCELEFRDTFGGDLRFRFVDRIRAYSEQLDYARGRFWIAVMEAAEHYLRSDHQKALEGFNALLSQVTGFGDPRVKNLCLGALADIHKSLGNYEVALRYALDGLEAVRETGDQLQEGWFLQGIAAGSNDLGDHSRALEYAEMGLALFERLDEKLEEPQARVGMARCKTEIGTAYFKMGKFEEARREHEDSLPYYRGAKNRIGEARALTDLGLLAQEEGNFDEAESLHRQSLEIRREIGNRQSQATSLLNLGELALIRDEPEEGIKFLEDALAIAQETGARLRQYQVHAALASAQERRGDFAAALEHHRQFHEIKEQVSNDSLHGRIADLQMRFEIEAAEKEAEIERLRNVELKRTLEELKSAQDRLVHAEKMASLGAMTAGIAHEIKNPLNFVNNFAAMSIELVDELKGELADRTEAASGKDGDAVPELLHDVRANAERILEHGRRADGIVKNMLMHAGGKSSEKRPFDLNELVDEYVSLAYHGARAKDSTFNVSVETDLDETIDEVDGVPEEIGRVVLNLVGNAFDALHGDGEGADVENPRVAVSTAQKGDFVELIVKDNGAGIPKDMRGRIFEPFFTTKPAGTGTGLGLSLSYDIVVQGHGGELVHEDQNGWTAFVVRLPMGESS